MSQLPNPDLSGERGSYPRVIDSLFELSLRPWWRAALFLIITLTVSSWLAHEAIRVAKVTYAVDSHFIPDIEGALREDPGNPELVHRLGLLYEFEPQYVNPSDAVKYLRMAVEISPRRWEFWTDLGTACDFAGDTACSDKAFEQAVVLNPMTPVLQWTVGNHYLLTDREEKAFPFFRRLLELAPDYLDATFRLCLRATRNPQAIYAQVVPGGKNASARFAFLMFLASTGDYESAMRIWGQMASGPDHSPALSLVKPFLDFLIDHNQIQDASTVWEDIHQAGVIPAVAMTRSANLLYDGSFGALPLNMGFDWHIDDSPDLIFDFSDPSGHNGAKCLRIEFVVGRNGDYDLVNQVVRIKPNTQYRVTAYTRSQNLTSNSGPRLRVVDLGCGDCNVRTSDPTVGTTSWHPIEVSFLTPPQAQAVKISFWRPPDQTYAQDITGTVWLDDVTLRTVEAPGADVKQERPR